LKKKRKLIDHKILREAFVQAIREHQTETAENRAFIGSMILIGVSRQCRNAFALGFKTARIHDEKVSRG